MPHSKLKKKEEVVNIITFLLRFAVVGGIVVAIYMFLAASVQEDIDRWNTLQEGATESETDILIKLEERGLMEYLDYDEERAAAQKKKNAEYVAP